MTLESNPPLASQSVFSFMGIQASLRWERYEKAALEFQPHDVPTAKSMPCLPLTLHYTLWLAACLEQYGFSKHSLLVLAASAAAPEAHEALSLVRSAVGSAQHRIAEERIGDWADELVGRLNLLLLLLWSARLLLR